MRIRMMNDEFVASEPDFLTSTESASFLDSNVREYLDLILNLWTWRRSRLSRQY